MIMNNKDEKEKRTLEQLVSEEVLKAVKDLTIKKQTLNNN